MSKVVDIAIPVAIVAGIGLAGALVTGHEFAIPFGGVLGFLVGLADSVWRTANTPKDLREHHFVAYVGRGRYGTLFRHDSRFLFTFMMAFMCGLAGFLWQLVFVAFS
jgi:hypothetical protein